VKDARLLALGVAVLAAAAFVVALRAAAAALLALTAALLILLALTALLVLLTAALLVILVLILVGHDWFLFLSFHAGGGPPLAGGQRTLSAPGSAREHSRTLVH
jgi:hypothetical protein